MADGGRLNGVGQESHAAAVRRWEAAELAAQRKREADERAAWEAQAAVQKQAQKLASPTDNFAARNGIDTSHARNHLFRRLGERLPTESNAAQSNNAQSELSGDLCPTTPDPPQPVWTAIPEQKKEKKEHKGLLGWARDTAVDGVKTVIEAGESVIRAGVEVGEDAIRAGGRFMLNTTEVVVDGARGTIDFAKGVEGNLEDVVRGAALRGLRLTGRSLARVHDFVLGKIDSALNVSESIDQLGVGDSYKLGGSSSIGFGIDADVAGDIIVTRTKDGYTVSAQVNGDLGLDLLEEVAPGVGAKVEFKFTDVEDAKKAALVLAGVGASMEFGMEMPVLLPALLPHPSELKLLGDNLSAVEVNDYAKVEYDRNLDMGFIKGGALAEAKLSQGYRIEFERGKPVVLVLINEYSGDVVAKEAYKYFNNRLGDQEIDILQGAFNVGGQAEAAITIETRIKLDSAAIPNIAAFIAAPNNLAFVGAGETSINASLVLDGGGKGVIVQAELTGLSAADGRHAVSNLSNGRFADIFEGTGVPHLQGTFTDTGYNLGFDLKWGPVGMAVEGHSEVRDVTAIGSSNEQEASPARNHGRGAPVRYS